MLVEVRALYVNKEHWYVLPQGGMRFASIELDVPHVTTMPPLAFDVVAGDARVDYRSHEERLYRHHIGHLQLRGGGLPVLAFTGQWHDGWRWAKPEGAADLAEPSRYRKEAIEAATAWAARALIVDDGVEAICLRPAPEPLIVVVPPGDTSKAPWIDPHRPTKVATLRTIYRNDAESVDEAFHAALCEDRLFRVDESAEALARAKEFDVRVSRGRNRYEIGDGRWAGVDLSGTALRLAGRDAIRMLGDDADPETSIAGRTLAVAIDDPDANAAALCPHVRGLLASFASSPRMLRLSQEGDLAVGLDRLRRTHDRAQKRMAAGRIPDHDPRALAPADDAAMERFGL
jgi:hypothetical protein